MKDDVMALTITYILDSIQSIVRYNREIIVNFEPNLIDNTISRYLYASERYIVTKVLLFSIKKKQQKTVKDNMR